MKKEFLLITPRDDRRPAKMRQQDAARAWPLYLLDYTVLAAVHEKLFRALAIYRFIISLRACSSSGAKPSGKTDSGAIAVSDSRESPFGHQYW